MGESNSSVTRVWPVFDYLLQKDSTGSDWLPDLIELALRNSFSKPLALRVGKILPEISKFDRPIPGNMKRVLTIDHMQAIGSLRNAFEVGVAPPYAFLRWALENPTKLSWPMGKDKRRAYDPPTQTLRERLVAGDPDVRNDGIEALQRHGAAGSARKWWAFEGFTSVDCRIETYSMIIFVEGKRTEALSKSTHWFPQRNQLVRNVEAAAEQARKAGKEFAVIVCAEKPLPVEDKDFDDSLPHLSTQECDELKKHYLGSVTWEQVRAELCPEIALPVALDDAVEFCCKLR